MGSRVPTTATTSTPDTIGEEREFGQPAGRDLRKEAAIDVWNRADTILGAARFLTAVISGQSPSGR
jgi:hypothetical protein